MYEQAVPQTHIALQLGVNRDTVRMWIKGIKTLGLTVFLDTHAAAKKGPRIKRQVDPLLKRYVWEDCDRVGFGENAGCLSNPLSPCYPHKG